MNLCNININQKSTSTSERFMSAKKLFEKSIFHNNIKENKLLSCSRNITEGSKEVYNIIYIYYYLQYNLLMYIFFIFIYIHIHILYYSVIILKPM